MHRVNVALTATDSSLAETAIHVDRQTLARKHWRAAADDGTEFEFDLAAPLRHGDTVFCSASQRYVVRQKEESLLAIALDLTPSAAAGIGWAIGNMHCELSAEPARLLTPDTPATRQMLERMRLPYTPTRARFQPGRFARGSAPGTQEYGPSHRHPPAAAEPR